eukprot:TRINITY_DN72776_c0_g1_i1.p1 TRINITY_DN72776_c0_g1~~TRINITY_DN72776_c0_g1_i1.p1  ORF type:complete len:407 (+),score=72.35 TRINITY_DN72776_c0_g1_i1:318-1538(+)
MSATPPRSRSKERKAKSRSRHRGKQAVRVETSSSGEDPTDIDDMEEDGQTSGRINRPSAGSGAQRSRTAITFEHVPPEFAWLSQALTKQTEAVHKELDEQFANSNHKIKKVAKHVKAVEGRLGKTEDRVKSLREGQKKFQDEYYRDKVANDLGLKLLREEVNSVRSGQPGSSSAAPSVASTAAPAGANPYQRNLDGTFITGNHGGIDAGIATMYLSELAAKAGVVISSTEYAKPFCSYAFLRFAASGGRGDRDNGYVWKKYLEENPTQPPDPSTSLPLPPGSKADLWSNLHREQEERDKRNELNMLKSYLHDFRKLHNHAESYKVRTAQVRLISAFTPGSEDVKWRNQMVCTFRKENDIRVPVWKDKATLDAVLGPEATNASHPWDYQKFLDGWEEFQNRRRGARR